MDYPTYNEQQISKILTDDLETESYKYVDQIKIPLTDKEKEIVRLSFIAGGKYQRYTLWKSLEW